MKFYQNTTNQNNYSFLNNSTHNELDKLNLQIEDLEKKNEKLQKENSELKKFNKNLNSKLNLLINDNDIVKNVKLDMQDYSDYTYCNNNEDSLKEFFYLLVICEKMKYMNLDYIWMIESSVLYKEVQNLDVAFYEWGSYLKNRLEKEHEEYCNKINKNENESGVITKLKNLWYESSLTFFNKINIVKKNNSSSSSKNLMAKMNNLEMKNGGDKINEKTNDNLLNTNIMNKCTNIIKSKKTKDNFNIKEMNEEIEKLLLQNENSFIDNTELTENTYNSFLNN